MSDESSESVAKRSVSRRTALKAGVAGGVGLVAWSGATITSLGGTPAYASGCTNVVKVDLSGGCRNTDQGTPCPGGGAYRYHPLNSTGFPAGYSISNNVAEGTCCDLNSAPLLHFPAGITCAGVITFSTGNCSAVVQQIPFGPSSDGSAGLAVPLDCYTGGAPSGSKYFITAKCATTGAPTSCIS